MIPEKREYLDGYHIRRKERDEAKFVKGDGEHKEKLTEKEVLWLLENVADEHTDMGFYLDVAIIRLKKLLARVKELEDQLDLCKKTNVPE